MLQGYVHARPSELALRISHTQKYNVVVLEYGNHAFWVESQTISLSRF